MQLEAETGHNGPNGKNPTDSIPQGQNLAYYLLVPTIPLSNQIRLLLLPDSFSDPKSQFLQHQNSFSENKLPHYQMNLQKVQASDNGTQTLLFLGHWS